MKNFPRIAMLKIRYKRRLKIAYKQCFYGKPIIKVEENSSVFVAERVECRGYLYILAVNGGSVKIGEHCFFNTNCSITGVNSIDIGRSCKFGNNVVIVDHDHNYKHIGEEEFLSGEITIGNNVWIGANTVILRGTHIGDNCVIAAGSVIKGYVPNNSICFMKKEMEIRDIERK